MEQSGQPVSLPPGSSRDCPADGSLPKAPSGWVPGTLPPPTIPPGNANEDLQQMLHCETLATTFQPQRHSMFVKGRPVVVPGKNHTKPPGMWPKSQ